MSKCIMKMTGRKTIFADTVENVHVDELWQDGKLAGMQMTWEGRAITIWKDGALGVSGVDGDSHLYVK
jgi:hypothetical protein